MAEGDHIVVSFTPGFRDGCVSEADSDPILAEKPETAVLFGQKLVYVGLDVAVTSGVVMEMDILKDAF